MPIDSAAVFLDCDGVLVDSESLSASVLSAMLAEKGHELTVAAALELLRGREVAIWIAELFDRFPLASTSGTAGLAGAARTPDAFKQAYRARVSAAYRHGLAAEPHAQHLLDELRVRDIPYAIVSNAPEWKIRDGLYCAGLDASAARACVSAYDLGSWKPEPTVYLEAASRLGVAQARCIAVEDSDAGVRAAACANMIVIHYAPDASVPAHPLAAARSADHLQTAALVADLTTEGVAA